MRMTVDQIAMLLREVARHRKKTRISIDYDGGGAFVVTFEKIHLSVEEYKMLAERANEK
jgi:hypothetical protein